MEECEIFYNLRKKKDKTQTEKLLLRYKRAFAFISEILVDESKCNINEKEAINRIREYLENM